VTSGRSISSSSLHRGSDESADAAEASGAERESGPSKVRSTVIVQNRYTLDAGLTTGKHIKEMAHVPTGFIRYRRVKAGNEPISDDALIEPHNGDHFFARPPSNTHGEQ
jgi:hypothetical protein